MRLNLSTESLNFHRNIQRVNWFDQQSPKYANNSEDDDCPYNWNCPSNMEAHLDVIEITYFGRFAYEAHQNYIVLEAVFSDRKIFRSVRNKEDFLEVRSDFFRKSFLWGSRGRKFGKSKKRMGFLGIRSGRVSREENKGLNAEITIFDLQVSHLSKNIRLKFVLAHLCIKSDLNWSKLYFYN